RRVAHTAHHRAEQTTLLRLLGRQVWSVYGPAVDTGGLPANGARTIYAYPDVEALITGESRGGSKTALPGPGPKPSTERPKKPLHRGRVEFPAHRDQGPRPALGVPAEADVRAERVLIAEEALDRIAVVDAVGARQGVQRVNRLGAELHRVG